MPTSDESYLYKRLPFLEAYAAHTDRRVEEDPHKAVGGRWDEIGLLQFNYLVERGLKPSHTLLDIGCGTLRGGRHFIRYLDRGNYTGSDISPKALDYARQLVAREGIEQKKPTLILSPGPLRFTEFAGAAFDFLLAQSVFTHLPPDLIKEAIENVGRAMKPAAHFYFTFRNGIDLRQIDVKEFQQPFDFYAAIAEPIGLSVSICGDYQHPRGQAMALLRVIK